MATARSPAKLPINFRLVQGTKNVFRCGNPDRLNDESTRDFINTFKIKTILDLRNTPEFRIECRGTPISNYFQYRDGAEINKFHEQPVRFLTQLAGLDFQLKILAELNFFQKFVYLYYIAKCWMFGGNEYNSYPTSRLVSLSTLAKQNIYLLDSSTKQMKSLFSAFLQQHHFPILICCKLGKDRTGLVSAIIMKLLDCSDEETVDAYHKSEEHLTPLYPAIKKYLVDDLGLSEEFAKTPKYVMEETLQHINHRYGGVEGYLQHIGFTKQEVDTIKSNVREM